MYIIHFKVGSACWCCVFHFSSLAVFNSARTVKTINLLREYEGGIDEAIQAGQRSTAVVLILWCVTKKTWEREKRMQGKLHKHICSEVKKQRALGLFLTLITLTLADSEISTATERSPRARLCTIQYLFEMPAILYLWLLFWSRWFFCVVPFALSLSDGIVGIAMRCRMESLNFPELWPCAASAHRLELALTFILTVTFFS